MSLFPVVGYGTDTRDSSSTCGQWWKCLKSLSNTLFSIVTNCFEAAVRESMIRKIRFCAPSAKERCSSQAANARRRELALFRFRVRYIGCENGLVLLLNHRLISISAAYQHILVVPWHVASRRTDIAAASTTTFKEHSAFACRSQANGIG